MALEKETILEVIKAIHPDAETYEHRDQLSVYIPAEKIIDVCRELRDHEKTQFDMLIDLTAIDWARKKDRFEIVYFLYSNKFKARVRLKVRLDGDFPACPSLAGVWESANWYEREVYDMFGIKFDGHPNLRRFYMPEDFNDPETKQPLYPMRKEFPMMGVPGSLPLPPFPEKDGENE